MKIRLNWLIVLCVFVAALVASGCAKEEEVGYGGEVKQAPGGKAPPPGKGAGMQVDPNN